jgi:hypothetical protein
MTALSGVEIQLVGYAENTKRSKKSEALGMTKERVPFSWKTVAGQKAFSNLIWRGLYSYLS